MADPTIAKTVVLNAAAFKFEVDGKPFPWHLPEDAAPTARKISEGRYEVHIGFYAIVVGQENQPCSFAHTEWEVPVICGVEFPWYIHEEGIKYTVGRGELGLIELAFFAEHVEGMDVTDAEAPPDGKTRELGGYVICKQAA